MQYTTVFPSSWVVETPARLPDHLMNGIDRIARDCGFVTLTLDGGRPVMVRPDHVSAIAPADDEARTAYVRIDDRWLKVMHDPSEIAEAVAQARVLS